MSIRFRDYLNECLKDEEFRAEYEACEMEAVILEEMTSIMTARGLTQYELSRRTGIPETELSALHDGYTSPSLSMLQRIALGMNMKLKFELVPA